MSALFLSSGLFLGWSLGANDASNVFGTAVGTRMLRFRTAAIACSIFVILGAVLGGAGATHTLGKLGAVDALAGAFMVALAAGCTVYLMTWARFPVSTSQAIVGAIVGWNLFSGSLIDYDALWKIMGTWVACPLLSAVFAVLLYLLLRGVLGVVRPHMFRLDMATRVGLLLSGIFGSYALGANNIANVMGVFVPIAPFGDITFAGITLSGEQQLYLLGGLAIAVGVMTYSKRVMYTVGNSIMRLSPVAAFVVVTAHSLVLFLFASRDLQQFLVGMGLPAIPLVPVSSSQAVVGAVVGIGLLKGGTAIRWRTVAGITSSWVVTPAFAAALCLVCLFFLQNVFEQATYRPTTYRLTHEAEERLRAHGVESPVLKVLGGNEYENAQALDRVLARDLELSEKQRELILESLEIDTFHITAERIYDIPGPWITPEQKGALYDLPAKEYAHRWMLWRDLAATDAQWKPWAGNTEAVHAHNRELEAKFRYICRYLRDFAH